jgi:hypothetical protein
MGHLQGIPHQLRQRNKEGRKVFMQEVLVLQGIEDVLGGARLMTITVKQATHKVGSVQLIDVCHACLQARPWGNYAESTSQILDQFISRQMVRGSYNWVQIFNEILSS